MHSAVRAVFYSVLSISNISPFGFPALESERSTSYFLWVSLLVLVEIEICQKSLPHNSNYTRIVLSACPCRCTKFSFSLSLQASFPLNHVLFLHHCLTSVEAHICLQCITNQMSTTNGSQGV